MKNNKFRYYFSNGLIKLLPSFLFRVKRARLMAGLERHDKEHVLDRVDYYNKLQDSFQIAPDATEIGQFQKTKGWTYFFDTYAVVKYFNKHLKFKVLNGDIQYVPDTPCLLKSRPINDENQNSVLLKLNLVRHFNFIKDPHQYQDKQDIAFWRGIGKKEHRKVVIRQFYDHPRCDIGQSKPLEDEPWVKGFVPIEEQLQYKFLLCIEGNDVASNLKWAMSSNSLVMMSKPKFETWFMEGRLTENVHYVLLKDDYSDLIEKMDYYLEHENEALEIISNAHKWCDQFKNKERERLISLLVCQKYFQKSNQI